MRSVALRISLLAIACCLGCSAVTLHRSVHELTLATATPPPPPTDGGLYPDLRTEPPSALEFDIAPVDGASRYVLRFTNSIINMGEGPIEVRGTPQGGTVSQRISRADGTYIDRVAGQVVFHPAHDHWHFQSVMRFEVWERVAYDRWLASGRTDGRPGWQHAKLSSCLLDSAFGVELPGAAGEPIYDARCLPMRQGISVGWIDVYDQLLPDQWVVLGDRPLADGDYVLRSVADPENLLYESQGGLDQAREAEPANENVTMFTVRGGALVP